MFRVPQSTALLVVFKAYLASDHVSNATGKTIAITISKNGGAFGNPNAGATNATEISSGWYKVSLDSTDTNTAGPLIVKGTEGTIDQVDTLYFIGDGLGNLDATVSSRASQASVDTIDNFVDTEIADIQARLPAALVSGRIDASVGAIAANAITAAAINAAALNGKGDWNVGKTGYALTTAEEDAIVDKVWDELKSAHTVADSFGDYLDDETTSRCSQSTGDLITTNQTEILNRLRGITLVQGTVGATGNDATHVHVSGLAYGNDEINNTLMTIFDASSGLSYSRWINDYDSAGDLATVDALPFTPASGDTYRILTIRKDVSAAADPNVALIKAKTDSLTFTVAGQIDANTRKINGVTVIGAGTSGDKWRA